MPNNLSKVSLTDGREVCFSYGVPVAAFIPKGLFIEGPSGYIRRDEYFSVTTSKHANGYAGKDAPKVRTADFLTLISPISAGR